MRSHTVTTPIVATLTMSAVMLTGCDSAQTTVGGHNTSTTSPPSAGLSATSTNPAQATIYAIPGCFSDTGTTADHDRPTSIVLQGCMSNGLWLKNMSWKAWGADGADGTGVIAANTCAADCASGPVVEHPVVVHAQKPEVAPGSSHCPANVQFYSEVVIAFPKDSPPTQYVKVTTRYRDMPASEITSQSRPTTPNEWGFPQCS
jgi:hypothetical protein